MNSPPVNIADPISLDDVYATAFPKLAPLIQFTNRESPTCNTAPFGQGNKLVEVRCGAEKVDVGVFSIQQLQIQKEERRLSRKYFHDLQAIAKAQNAEAETRYDFKAARWENSIWIEAATLATGAAMSRGGGTSGANTGLAGFSGGPLGGIEKLNPEQKKQVFSEVGRTLGKQTQGLYEIWVQGKEDEITGTLKEMQSASWDHLASTVFQVQDFYELVRDKDKFPKALRDKIERAEEVLRGKDSLDNHMIRDLYLVAPPETQSWINLKVESRTLEKANLLIERLAALSKAVVDGQKQYGRMLKTMTEEVRLSQRIGIANLGLNLENNTILKYLAFANLSPSQLRALAKDPKSGITLTPEQDTDLARSELSQDFRSIADVADALSNLVAVLPMDSRTARDMTVALRATSMIASGAAIAIAGGPPGWIVGGIMILTGIITAALGAPSGNQNKAMMSLLEENFKAVFRNFEDMRDRLVKMAVTQAQILKNIQTLREEVHLLFNTLAIEIRENLGGIAEAQRSTLGLAYSTERKANIGNCDLMLQDYRSFADFDQRREFFTSEVSRQWSACLTEMGRLSGSVLSFAEGRSSQFPPFFFEHPGQFQKVPQFEREKFLRRRNFRALAPLVIQAQGVSPAIIRMRPEKYPASELRQRFVDMRINPAFEDVDPLDPTNLIEPKAAVEYARLNMLMDSFVPFVRPAKDEGGVYLQIPTSEQFLQARADLPELPNTTFKQTSVKAIRGAETVVQWALLQETLLSGVPVLSELGAQISSPAQKNNLFQMLSTDENLSRNVWIWFFKQMPRDDMYRFVTAAATGSKLSLQELVGELGTIVCRHEALGALAKPTSVSSPNECPVYPSPTASYYIVVAQKDVAIPHVMAFPNARDIVDGHYYSSETITELQAMLKELRLRRESYDKSSSAKPFPWGSLMNVMLGEMNP